MRDSPSCSGEGACVGGTDSIAICLLVRDRSGAVEGVFVPSHVVRGVGEAAERTCRHAHCQVVKVLLGGHLACKEKRDGVVMEKLKIVSLDT